MSTFWLYFRSTARDIVTSPVLRELKYVELDMIECCNRSTTTTNGLYAWMHPYIEGLSQFLALLGASIIFSQVGLSNWTICELSAQNLENLTLKY